MWWKLASALTAMNLSNLAHIVTVLATFLDKVRLVYNANIEGKDFHQVALPELRYISGVWELYMKDNWSHAFLSALILSLSNYLSLQESSIPMNNPEFIQIDIYRYF